MRSFYPTVLVSALFFSGCSTPPDPITQTPAYQEGRADGCRTAKGDYTKDHEGFRTDTAYHEGWFAGRKACNPDTAQTEND